MDRFTKILSVVSPKRAAERLKNQVALKMMDEQSRKYEGAGRGRRFKGFDHHNASTNQQIATALPVLRDRSRDISKNNPYGKSSIRKIGNNVVGTGILAVPITKSKALDKSVKELWATWADDSYCDFDDLQNFYGIQKMVMKTVAKCGECVVRRVWNKRSKKANGIVPLELQVLEPDFIDHEKNTLTAFDNGEYTVNGVQFNKAGKRIAYWIFDRHPLEANAISQPVPAEDIIHVFDVEDPGQVRGIPFFSSSILRMKDFDEFEDAELMKQKIAACFAVFVESADATGVEGENTTDDLTERIEPGIIQRGLPGDKFTFASPPAFNALRDYSHQSLQGQAAGVGLSYEEYTGDLSNTNFSSGRMGWLAMHRNIEDWQWNMMIPMFCNKVWKWFIKASILSGNLPHEVKEADIKVTWTAPRREMIDPTKETKALVEMIRGGLLSWQDAVRQLGFSPDEIIEQMKKDRDMFDKAGLMPECDPRYDADKMIKNARPDEGKTQAKKQQTPE